MSYPATSKNKKMRCISTLLISLLRAVPAMSVELFQYRVSDRLNPPAPGRPAPNPQINNALTQNRVILGFFTSQVSTLMEIPQGNTWNIAENRTLKSGSSDGIAFRQGCLRETAPKA
jgi:hypothetical protein